MTDERATPPARDDELPAGETDRPAGPRAGESPSRQVAQVNMRPDEPLDDVAEAEAVPVTGEQVSTPTVERVEGGWGPMAWLLGLLALAIGVGGLIFVLQGVFQAMPS